MRGLYQTTIQCEHCGDPFEAKFESPEETFATTCPHCGTHYPEEYV